MAKKNKKRSGIRTRIAPSPTGKLHIGTVRTALFNWLFAKHHAGEFVLRIEDTDLERSSVEFEKNILSGLEWLGLKWNEFYKQSERLDRYEKHLKKLLEEKKAFWCYHTKEELEKEKEEQTQKKEAPRHICEHKLKIKEGEGIIRLAVDENSTRIIHFEDQVRGHIEFEQKVIGDLSLAKDLRTPLYNFAVVVDDYEMKITHVIRGEDHIANTPKQILIAEALGFNLPKFAHLPLILDEDRSKLSKRHGAVNFDEYIRAGYLSESLVNFLALLGWSPKETQKSEILTKNEIIEQFNLEKVHKSGAVFDIKKLNWINSQYIKKFNDEGLAELVAPFIERHFGKQPREKLLRLVSVFRERLEYLDQVKELKYFFQEPEYAAELLVWKKSDKEGAKNALESVSEILNTNTGWEVFDEEHIRSKLDKLSEEKFGGDRGAVYWPLRVALTGERFSPDPVEIMKIVGKKKTLVRVQNALAK